MSCEEDEEKVIQTDLSTEAAQLFSISKDWSESLYFAMISWKEYQNIDSLNLPNCPAVFLDQENKEITLNFLDSTTCIQSGEYSRSGKLIIKFADPLDSLVDQWTMVYDDYRFDSKNIDGFRTFTRVDSLQVMEEFTALIERTDNGLSTEFSGNFSHSKIYIDDTLSHFSSTGNISGVNAVGRGFEIAIIEPINHTVFCLQANEILPAAGNENWFVSRGGTSEVTYSTSYESLIDSCKVAVNTTLPDGRKLFLNPTE